MKTVCNTNSLSQYISQWSLNYLEMQTEHRFSGITIVLEKNKVVCSFYPEHFYCSHFQREKLSLRDMAQ